MLGLHPGNDAPIEGGLSNERQDQRCEAEGFDGGVF